MFQTLLRFHSQFLQAGEVYQRELYQMLDRGNHEPRVTQSDGIMVLIETSQFNMVYQLEILVMLDIMEVNESFENQLDLPAQTCRRRPLKFPPT